MFPVLPVVWSSIVCVVDAKIALLEKRKQSMFVPVGLRLLWLLLMLPGWPKGEVIVIR
jgi:hypothetical protein